MAHSGTVKVKILMAESQPELKSLSMRVKEESEKADLKHNTQQYTNAYIWNLGKWYR